MGLLLYYALLINKSWHLKFLFLVFLDSYRANGYDTDRDGQEGSENGKNTCRIVYGELLFRTGQCSDIDHAGELYH